MKISSLTQLKLSQNFFLNNAINIILTISHIRALSSFCLYSILITNIHLLLCLFWQLSGQILSTDNDFYVHCWSSRIYLICKYIPLFKVLKSLENGMCFLNRQKWRLKSPQTLIIFQALNQGTSVPAGYYWTLSCQLKQIGIQQ